jgi:hypothetical protein
LVAAIDVVMKPRFTLNAGRNASIRASEFP